VLITLPAATEGLLVVVGVPTTSPAPVNVASAAACAKPTTFGTATWAAGPLDTSRSTADPAFTNVPAAGFVLITLPAATEGLLVVVGVPTTSPAPVNVAPAAACAKPTTFGTGI
jgi:hypothetical protein